MVMPNHGTLIGGPGVSPVLPCRLNCPMRREYLQQFVTRSIKIRVAPPPARNTVPVLPSFRPVEVIYGPRQMPSAPWDYPPP